MATLIAGCGYVGSELGRRLAADGEAVWGLTPEPADLPPGVRSIVADLGDPATLTDLPPCDRAVFSAAPRGHDQASYRGLYVDGLRNLLAALLRQPTAPTRLVFCSSLGVYDQQDGSLVDEASPVTTTKMNGLVMLEAEALAAASAIRSVSVRLAGIYGDDRRRVVDDVMSGAAQRSKEPSVFSNLIHRDDCAGAIRHLLDHPDPEPLYLAVDHEPVPRNDLLLGIAELAGVAAPPLGDGGGTSRWLRQRPGERGKRLSSARLRASGYTFEFPTWREGYAAILGV